MSQGAGTGRDRQASGRKSVGEHRTKRISTRAKAIQYAPRREVRRKLSVQIGWGGMIKTSRCTGLSNWESVGMWGDWPSILPKTWMQNVRSHTRTSDRGFLRRISEGPSACLIPDRNPKPNASRRSLLTCLASCSATRTGGHCFADDAMRCDAPCTLRGCCVCARWMLRGLFSC
jgi:hypothetical protein